MNTKDIKARSIFVDAVYDLAIEANIAGTISNEEYVQIRNSLVAMDPLVGIKS